MNMVLEREQKTENEKGIFFFKERRESSEFKAPSKNRMMTSRKVIKIEER